MKEKIRVVMRRNSLAIVGLLLIVAVIGHFHLFENYRFFGTVGSAAGLLMLVGYGTKKATFLINQARIATILGTMLVVLADKPDWIMTTVIGSVLIIAGLAIRVIVGGYGKPNIN